MKLALNTNAFCNFAEGLPDAVDAIAAGEGPIFIPSIVIGELTYKFMKGSKIPIHDIWIAACCMEVGWGAAHEGPPLRGCGTDRNPGSAVVRQLVLLTRCLI